VATVEDPAWVDGLKVGLVNGHAGSIESKSGVLAQNATVSTTNHGLATIAPARNGRLMKVHRS